MRSQSPSVHRCAPSLEHFEARPFSIIAEAATHDVSLSSTTRASLIDSLLAAQSLLVMNMSPHVRVEELEALIATHLVDGLVRDERGTHVDTTAYAMEDIVMKVTRGALRFDDLAAQAFCDVVTASARGRMVRTTTPHRLRAAVALASSSLLVQPDTAALTHELTAWLTGTQVVLPRDLSHLGAIAHALEETASYGYAGCSWRELRATIRRILETGLGNRRLLMRDVLSALDALVMQLRTRLHGRPRDITRAERELACALLLGSLEVFVAHEDLGLKTSDLRIAIPGLLAHGSFVVEGIRIVPIDMVSSFNTAALEHFLLGITSAHREAIIQLVLAITLAPPTRQDLRLQLMAWLTDWGCVRATRGPSASTTT